VLAKCLLAKCLFAKCLLAKCLLAKCLLAKCLLANAFLPNVCWQNACCLNGFPRKFEGKPLSVGKMPVGQMFFDQKTWIPPNPAKRRDAFYLLRGLFKPLIRKFIGSYFLLFFILKLSFIIFLMVQ
jgi:hypothetical protein